MRQTTKRDDPVTAGHYYLLRCYGTPESREYRSTLIYNLPVAFITLRTLSRSGTASASETQSKKNEGHNEKTRNNVRLRDRRCRMTGSVVRQRNRGYNFTGFQVAHIFPIGWVPSIPRPPTPHCLFDDYQIGIHPDCLEQITYDNKTYWARRLYRFEKDGAYDLQNCNYLHPPASMGQQLSVDYIIPNVQEPNDDLLRHHFETCILWHVSGAGKTPKLG
ncbi:hypothetical protein CPB84DRAFT_1330963 [Gymnopilus junonius]|uniref:HNH nuclease domain-containing protein n=1 Tax=Gymnopilus junonius TaxID=109634 RepID=A0A9P5NHN2_GYMJU|nr:hypothetical protein CPB84DRAFT_1330963 [Gymnopilus junonius]